MAINLERSGRMTLSNALTPCAAKHGDLTEESHPETKDLLAILRPLDNGEAEVERDRQRSQHWDRDSQPGAGCSPVILDLDIRLNRSGINEEDSVKLVVGENRNLVFQTVEELKIAADGEPVDKRPHSAELESAHAA